MSTPIACHEPVVGCSLLVEQVCETSSAGEARAALCF
jgi:hypothetical protein